MLVDCGPAPLLQRAAVLLVLLLSVSLQGCGEYAPEDGDDPGISSTLAKAGLPGPPAPVGPFLNGAFPSRTPTSVGSATWSIVEAFPNVQFNQTLVIETNPHPSDDRLYVGSRDGKIFSMENTPSVSVSEPFMDISDRTAVVWDGGFLGLAFHPEFGVPGSPYETAFYTYYSSYCPTTFDGQEYVNDFANCNPGYPQGSTGGFFNTWLRLSRFDAFFDSGAGVWRGDPTTERPMVNIRLYNGSHRGGGPVFGHDGLMYVIIGDQFRYDTAQDIEGNFEGGSIRVAVDVTDNGDGTWTCPANSHAPRRTMQDISPNADEMSGQQYCIPDDNPWLNANGDLFEDFYSIGHRNPHRISVDRLTGRIWSGEVGQNTREEINVILKGRNYQWPFMEGLTTGVRPRPSTILGVEQPPVIDFTRTEARTIIGGYVYRGSMFPELYGKYITGDYSTNNIWALTLNETTMTATKDLLTVFQPGNLSTFGQDKDGEVYLGDVFGFDALYTLDRIGGPIPEPPALMSDLGAFQDTGDFVLEDYWVPYELNQPFWSDGAEKFRWIALANDGLRDSAEEQVAFSETGVWSYPVGTVLMKHFELVLDESDPSDRTRLETRFLVLGDDFNWYGVTYQWRPDQSDADLLTTFATTDYTIALADGGTRDQTWYFPSRQDCASCHLEVSGGALGLNTHQQNGDMFYQSTGITDNQLATWNELAMFSPPLDPATIPTMLRSVDFTDVTASLGDRARSWLDSNCGYCHRPGGANAGFDARLTTPFEFQGMAYAGVRDDLGFPGMTVLTPGDPVLSAIYQRAGAVGATAMPPLAKALAQTTAVDILREWILRLDPGLVGNGVRYDYYEPGSLSALPDFSALTPVSSGVGTSFDIGIREQDDFFAFRFTSLLYVSTAGDYTFFTSSDDGSQLLLDGALVVDNDGLHGVVEASGVITLAEGYHSIEVTMFERNGGQSLSVDWQGPDTGGVQEPISSGRLFLQQPADDNEPPSLSDPGTLQTQVGDPVSLNLQATDPNNDFLYFDAVGLPPGLLLDNSTGQISGSPMVAGTNDVTASASDASEISVVSFTWNVVPGTTPVCGDGNLDAGEECDDGNVTSGDGCTSSCVLEVCGDGIINNSGAEACEPPATATCTDSCAIRTALCGDGFLTPPEQCEDGNMLDGDGCSSACTVEGSVACGDGFIDAGEDCDDGNLLDGDGCAFDCSYERGADLTQVGTIIARVTAPIGGGSKDPEVIRDGDKPPVGHWAYSRQYDTYSGGLFAIEDWIGYQYATELLFGRVLYQEGINATDGGYFDGLTVQARQSGSWVDVSGLTVTPVYAGDDGISYDSYVLDFTPVAGDAIRIYGAPGGSSSFISVGELEVFAATVPLLCGNGVPDAGEECDDGNRTNGDGCTASCVVEFCSDGSINNLGTEECDDGNLVDGDGCSSLCLIEVVPGCGDGNLDAGEECDDGNVTNGDGCTSSCVLEVCGDGIINNSGAEACEPPATATCTDSCAIRTALCGDGFLTPPEQCEDGNTIDGDGCSSACTVEIAPGCGNGVIDAGEDCDDGNSLDGDGCAFDCSYERGADLTQVGTIIARVTAPIGGGSKDPEVIRDGDKPPVGHWAYSRQYDTYSGGASATEDWIGYQYATELLFGRVLYQEGINATDGGYFDGLTVQTRQSGSWVDVSGLTVTPVYAGDDGISYDSYVLDFTPVAGDAIRIYGAPGGSSSFISVGELEVFAATVPLLCGNGVPDAGEECDDGNRTNGDGCTASCVVEFCSDGSINNLGTEECDDGNLVDGDGCSSLCLIEVVPGCGDGNLDAGEECDDGNVTNGDGCTSSCVLEVCGDGIINNSGAEACEPPATATCTDSCAIRTALCGDGFLTPPEQCEDGNTIDGDGCSSACTVEIAPGCGNGVIDAGEDCDDGNSLDGDGCAFDCSYERGADLTQVGTIIARVTAPIGGGSRDPEVIRDGDKPPVGHWAYSRQYDTYSGGASATEDWVGYQYATELLFGRVLYQEGINATDGGYFDSLTVQTRQSGSWVDVSGLTVTPVYAGDDGISYNSYVLDFSPVAGDAIRIYGAPGGSSSFISVGELEVFAAQ